MSWLTPVFYFYSMMSGGQKIILRKIYLLFVLFLIAYQPQAFATAFSLQKTIIVENKTELLSAVKPDSPYDRVIVKGVISDLENVQLKDGLTLEGMGTDSELKTTDSLLKNDLLILGKENEINNIKLSIREYSPSYTIRNMNGISVGHVKINRVISNGEMNIDIHDGSEDSQIDIENNLIELHNAPATTEKIASAIGLIVQNKSVMKVLRLANNKIVTVSGGLNLGIYNHASSHAKIQYESALQNNVINTDGPQSFGIYNFSSRGNVIFDQGIVDNQINVNGPLSYGIWNNTADDGVIKVNAGIIHNEIRSDGKYFSSGMVNQAQKRGIIRISGKIQDNDIKTIGVNSYGFENCAGKCDSFAGENPSGLIDLTQAQVSENKIHTEYDTTSCIQNIAIGQYATVNFGMGSAEKVKSALIKNNILVCPEDAEKVNNVVASGGKIS